MEDYRMYILVNEDIKLRKGKMANTVGHSIMSYIYHGMIKPIANNENTNHIMEFLDVYMQEQKKIILKCPQSKLEELEKEGKYVVVRDKGYTHLQPNTLTCVNIGIWSFRQLPDWVKELKLYN